jgi:hypothetical protein
MIVDSFCILEQYITGYTKPDDHSIGFLIDLQHQSELFRLLFYVRLIDTKSVDPKWSLEPDLSHCIQEIPKIAPNTNILSVYLYPCRNLGVELGLSISNHQLWGRNSGTSPFPVKRLN